MTWQQPSSEWTRLDDNFPNINPLLAPDLLAPSLISFKDHTPTIESRCSGASTSGNIASFLFPSPQIRDSWDDFTILQLLRDPEVVEWTETSAGGSPTAGPAEGSSGTDGHSVDGNERMAVLSFHVLHHDKKGTIGGSRGGARGAAAGRNVPGGGETFVEFGYPHVHVGYGGAAGGGAHDLIFDDYADIYGGYGGRDPYDSDYSYDSGDEYYRGEYY